MAEAKSGPPASLDDFFKSKAKKKPKATNMNAATEKPPEEEKPKVARPAPNPDALEGWERALRKDQDLLKACGLWIKEVDGDGACLFRAFADQLDGSNGSDHLAYRERCVDFLKAHRDDFEPFLDEDFNEYCSRMREPTAWGGHVEVQALSRALGVNAVIFQPTEAGRPDKLLSTCVEMVSTDEDSARCVQLSFHPQHHAGEHYNSVRCVDDNGEGAALCPSVTELKRRIADALKPPVKEEPASQGGGYAAATEAPPAAPVKKSPFKMR